MPSARVNARWSLAGPAAREAAVHAESRFLGSLRRGGLLRGCFIGARALDERRNRTDATQHEVLLCSNDPLDDAERLLGRSLDTAQRRSGDPTRIRHLRGQLVELLQRADDTVGDGALDLLERLRVALTYVFDNRHLP